MKKPVGKLTILIIGPPKSGKSTVLRAVVRNITKRIEVATTLHDSFSESEAYIAYGNGALPDLYSPKADAKRFKAMKGSVARVLVATIQTNHRGLVTYKALKHIEELVNDD